MKSKYMIVGAVICLCCVLLSGFMIWQHYSKEKQYMDEFDSLAELVQKAQDGERLNTIEVPFNEDENVLPDYSALYQQNYDFVGWLSIEGTNINYPVMQTPDRPNYYLKRNFEKKPSRHGVPFAAEHCDVFAPSDNIIIYGHHIKDGKMFGALMDYSSREFYEQHRIIRFDTMLEHAEYEIVAVFRTVAYSENGFPFFHFTNANGKEDFDAYIAECKRLALYETKVRAEYGDKLITLSTCEYSALNGRLMIVAKRILEDDS
ncbi:class B sortase [Eubacteriales bacterium OttesenSCG-928-M02]|nr:class B sortase [Eubacteriales bacterium OttesenSCG-928-M02]